MRNIAKQTEASLDEDESMELDPTSSGSAASDERTQVMEYQSGDDASPPTTDCCCSEECMTPTENRCRKNGNIGTSNRHCTFLKHKRQTTKEHHGLQRLKIGLFSQNKGVKYCKNGQVRCCRFCEILRTHDADFLYEEDDVAVFRPLHPIVPSHILVVPRCHIRNVDMLTTAHVGLLQRMRSIAERVLLKQSTRYRETRQVEDPIADEDDGLEEENHEHASADCKYAFHVPPFNSIDHVHMHAFCQQPGTIGCFGKVKYCTSMWWCRSYDDVLKRIQKTTMAPVSVATDRIDLSRKRQENEGVV